jgi:hypothetical protein
VRSTPFVLLLLLGMIRVAGADEVGATGGVVHIVAPGGVARAPVTADAMWRRIRRAAAKYQKYAPVPRAAFYDITYPATADEYRAVDGYGLLLVTVVTQERTEVPLARVSLKGVQSTHVFRLVSSIRSDVEDPEVSAVLGSTRFDALYFFPMHLRHTSGELLVDFGANRKEFVLGKFPLEPADDALPTEPPSGTHPPAGAFGALIKRELPIFVEVGNASPTRQPDR